MFTCAPLKIHGASLLCVCRLHPHGARGLGGYAVVHVDDDARTLQAYLLALASALALSVASPTQSRVVRGGLAIAFVIALAIALASALALTLLPLPLVRASLGGPSVFIPSLSSPSGRLALRQVVRPG